MPERTSNTAIMNAYAAAATNILKEKKQAAQPQPMSSHDVWKDSHSPIPDGFALDPARQEMVQQQVMANAMITGRYFAHSIKPGSIISEIKHIGARGNMERVSTSKLQPVLWDDFNRKSGVSSKEEYEAVVIRNDIDKSKTLTNKPYPREYYSDMDAVYETHIVKWGVFRKRFSFSVDNFELKTGRKFDDIGEDVFSEDYLAKRVLYAQFITDVTFAEGLAGEYCDDFNSPYQYCIKDSRINYPGTPMSFTGEAAGDCAEGVMGLIESVHRSNGSKKRVYCHELIYNDVKNYFIKEFGLENLRIGNYTVVVDNLDLVVTKDVFQKELIAICFSERDLSFVGSSSLGHNRVRDLKRCPDNSSVGEFETVIAGNFVCDNRWNMGSFKLEDKTVE